MIETQLQYSKPAKCGVIVALHKNAEMTTEHPDNVLSLQIIEGKIKLFANNDAFEVRKEQVIALHDNISYRVQALKKSVFLLTLTEGSDGHFL